MRFSLTKKQQTHFSWIATGLVLCALVACTTSASTPENQRIEQRLKPTGQSVTFEASRYKDFDDYVNQTQDHLNAYKVYLNPDNAGEELEAAMPFSVRPNQVAPIGQCGRPNGPTRGVVLLHGLSDMPAAMDDIANAFAERCFVTYSMLLPGHGARPAEMLDVSRDDWLAAARFGVDAMRTEVDEVYIGGFSLGGLIAVQTAMNDPDIAGVFAFSPAIALHRSMQLNQTIWLRHIVDWLDKDPPHDAWRFESIPFNALAETQLLAKSVQAQLKHTPLEAPVFIAQSPDDAVVNAAVNQALFTQLMPHPANRLISYAAMDTEPVPADTRIITYPSELPEQNILSYSHQAVHISPTNPHYGAQGSYRYCHINEGNADAVDRCLSVASPYRGEVFGSAVDRYNLSSIDTLARLTYNPQFNSLFDRIDQFLSSLDGEKQGGLMVTSTLN